MIKLVAFDWNGTILTDTKLTVQSESFVLVKFGLKPITLKRFQETFSIPFRLFWTKLGFNPKDFDKNVLAIRQAFFEFYEPREKFTKTRAGTAQILKWLDENEIDSIIFSNHMTGHIKQQLKRLGLKNFKAVLGYTAINDTSIMSKRGKGKQLEDYVKKNKFKPNEVLVIGDTDEEIDIAKKNGYKSVSVTGGYQSVARLKKAKTDFLISNFFDLKKIIQKINK